MPRTMHCSECHEPGHTRQWCPTCCYCKGPRADGQHNLKRNDRDECPTYKADRASGILDEREESVLAGLAQEAAERLREAAEALDRFARAARMRHLGGG